MSTLMTLPEQVHHKAPAAPILGALLSEAEQADLRRLEATIDKGRDTFVKVANAYSTIKKGREEYQAVLRALLEIHRKQLYREQGTFKNYVATKLEMSRSRAYQLLAAARICERSEAQGTPAPKNESQARRKATQPGAAKVTAEPEARPLSSFLETRPGVVILIEDRLAELRQLHASHACRGEADTALDVYRGIILGTPARKAAGAGKVVCA